MSGDSRDDGGRYTERVTPADVLDVFEMVDGPIVTSGDVAEVLGCSRETARRKLRTLDSRGVVASRKTAGRVVWWRTDPPHDTSITQVRPADPFWSLEPGASGTSTTSERVDEILYGSN